MSWSIVIPVKGSAGKSRLQAGDARAALAVAFARDAITAALGAQASSRVVVVTSDADAVAGIAGVEQVLDPGAGLTAAIRAGLAVVRPDQPAAVLLGDLPALTPAALDGALELAARESRAFVPDALATGTTLLTALRADALQPRFGEGSADRHRSAGHVTLPVPPESGLRIDVDELADLHRAVDAGIGPHTAAVLRAAATAA